MQETRQMLQDGSCDAGGNPYGSQDEKRTVLGAQSYSTTTALRTEREFVWDENNFIGLWFVELGGGNYLATLVKNPIGEIELQCRFRQYVDDKIGPASKDLRSFYTAKAPGENQTECIEASRKMAAALAKSADTSVFEIMMDEGGFDAVRQKMEQHPAFHFVPYEPGIDGRFAAATNSA